MTDFRALFEEVPEAGLVLTTDLRIAAVSDRFLAESRQGRGAVVGKTIFEVLPQVGTVPDAVRRAEELQQRNQELRDLQTDLEGRVASRTMELERVHEQLRQSQKLEAIGLLAGGIAHDFNNLLSVILSYSEILLFDLPQGARGRDEVQEIRRAGERARDLTRDLLAFSRQQMVNPRLLDVNDVLKDVTRMLARTLGENITLVTKPHAGPALVRADRGQLDQVIMNLVVNARDAMPNGGTLTIEVEEVELSADYVSANFEPASGPHVMLAVSDTGHGMDKATRDRIFEPFFTTKEHGRGTGLGLATVFGIVKQNGGRISVYSEVDVGTTFKIFLPRVDDQGELLAGPPENDRVLRTGSETILLAEDEEQVRRVVVSILRRAGYRVLEAGDPEAAFSIAESHEGPIELLLTDVVMPKLSGRQLAERVRAVRPTTKTLFMSGYTDDAILHHGVLDADVEFIQKPFTPEVLARKVREVLDGKG